MRDITTIEKLNSVLVILILFFFLIKLVAEKPRLR